jgi:hypothetical protein
MLLSLREFNDDMVHAPHIPEGSCHGNGPDPGAAAGTGLERDMGIGEEAVADDGEAEETSAAQTDDGDAGNVGDSPATAPTDGMCALVHTEVWCFIMLPALFRCDT